MQIMILTTHAVVGAGMSAVFPDNPAMVFVAAFVSHFLIDAAPHWDYRIFSLVKNENNRLDDEIKIGKGFYFDIARALLDAVSGVGIAVAVFHYYFGFSWTVVLAGAAAGCLPDALQFFYLKTKKEPFRALQRIHLAVHSRNKFLKRNFLLGASAQIIFIGLFAYLVGLLTQGAVANLQILPFLNIFYSPL